MKWDDDPRLLAYALDEHDALTDDDVREIEAALRTDGDCQRALDGLRAFLPALEDAVAAPAPSGLGASARRLIMDEAHASVSTASTSTASTSTGSAGAETPAGAARPVSGARRMRSIYGVVAAAAAVLLLAGVWGALQQLDRAGDASVGNLAVATELAADEAAGSAAGSAPNSAQDEGARAGRADLAEDLQTADAEMVDASESMATEEAMPLKKERGGYRGPGDAAPSLALRADAGLNDRARSNGAPKAEAAAPLQQASARSKSRAEDRDKAEPRERAARSQPQRDAEEARPRRATSLSGGALIVNRDDVRSTFPLVVGRASYDRAKRALERGRVPAPEALRVDEFISAFVYDDTPPVASSEHPWRVTIQTGAAPWRPEHRLVRVGLAGLAFDPPLLPESMTRSPASATPEVIAQNVRVHVRWNPRLVKAFRRVERGVDQGAGPMADPAGVTLRAGHRVTALYEVIPAGAAGEGSSLGPDVRGEPSLDAPAEVPFLADELVEVRLTYQLPGSDVGGELRVTAVDGGAAFAEAPVDLRFSAAAAAFVLVLSESPMVGETTLGDVQRWAQGTLGAAKDGQGGLIEAFLALVQRALDLESR